MVNTKHIISAGLGLYEADRFYRKLPSAKYNWTSITLKESNILAYQLVKAALIAQANKRINNG